MGQIVGNHLGGIQRIAGMEPHVAAEARVFQPRTCVWTNSDSPFAFRVQSNRGDGKALFGQGMIWILRVADGSGSTVCRVPSEENLQVWIVAFWIGVWGIDPGSDLNK